MPVAPHVPPLAILLAWIPISLVCFYRLPIRTAALVNFVGGWAILPTANFVPTNDPFPYWILGASLPAGYFVTKATITGLAGLAGILFFDPSGLRRFRPRVWDLPVAVWCAVPLLSGIANHAAYQGGLRDGRRGMVYLLLAWGGPYLLGRLYFDDDASLLLAARAFVIAGLCYVPICLTEVVTGPQFYAHIYGYQPFQWLGAERYIGYRPIGFLEDGNQLGIWMAAATLLAAGLWKHSKERHVLGLPIGWATVVLFAVTVLCQSGGSIVLLLCLLPFVLFSSIAFRRRFVIALGLMVLCFAGLRLTNMVSLRWLVDHERPARDVATLLAKAGRQSFGWRLEQDERHVRTALARPILGSGRWYWWQGGEERPWGLWLLAYGMYGGVGLLALEMMQFAPVAGAAWLSPSDLSDQKLLGPEQSDIEESKDEKPNPGMEDSEERDSDMRLAWAAVLLLGAIDNLLNSGMILPFVLAIGGMSVWKMGNGRARLNVDATIEG